MQKDGAPDRLPKTVGLPARAGIAGAQEARGGCGIMSEFPAASARLDRIRPDVTGFVRSGAGAGAGAVPGGRPIGTGCAMPFDQ